MAYKELSRKKEATIFDVDYNYFKGRFSVRVYDQYLIMFQDTKDNSEFAKNEGVEVTSFSMSEKEVYFKHECLSDFYEWIKQEYNCMTFEEYLEIN